VKVRADQVKSALATKHADDFFLTEVKDGPTQSVRNHFKLDALAFKKSWANPAIIGYEIKVDRADFMRDSKWPAYLPLCNQFSFVCPTGLIQPEELPQEVGLIYFNPATGSLFTKRKALHRLIDEPVQMYKYIIMSKMDSERHPFFSEKREYFEALVADKVDRRRLGYWVSKKLRELIDDYEKRIREFERQVNDLQSDKQFGEEARIVLQESGIRTGWGWQERLRTRLSVGVSDEMKNEVWKLKQVVNRLEEMTSTKKEEVIS
jgi:hypothetical protein